MPVPVAETISRTYERFSEWGYSLPELYESATRSSESVREKLAKFLGATPGELCFTRNTTEGINIVAHGLGLKDGDEVIISEEENPANILPWVHLARQRGIVIRRLALVDDSQGILDNLRKLISANTKLVAVSHVTHTKGLLLPVIPLTELAHEMGAKVLYDGAQAVGQVNVNLAEMGCDFYAGCGYKWLLGPPGTGFLYVRNENLASLSASYVGVGSQSHLDLDSLAYTLFDDARRYEFGARAWPLYLGLGVALDFVGSVGLEAIRAQALKLARQLRESLCWIPGVSVISPKREELMSGIVTFQVEGRSSATLTGWLWSNYRIHVQHRVWTQGGRHCTGVRCSLAFFNTDEEVERLALAITTVTERGGTPTGQQGVKNGKQVVCGQRVQLQGRVLHEGGK